MSEFMSEQEYFLKVKDLRHDPMVGAWINLYQDTYKNNYEDCKSCGFPHATNLMCHGATFGLINFGGNFYSIKYENIIYWVAKMKDYAPKDSFHWKNERFFTKTEDGVEITYFTQFNNCPQENKWKIPALEWKSICEFLERK